MNALDCVGRVSGSVVAAAVPCFTLLLPTEPVITVTSLVDAAPAIVVIFLIVRSMLVLVLPPVLIKCMFLTVLASLGVN